MSDQVCLRCRRPAPDEMSDEFDEWEADGASAGEHVICPGCLTLGEENAIIDDAVMTELDAHLEQGKGSALPPRA